MRHKTNEPSQGNTMKLPNPVRVTQCKLYAEKIEFERFVWFYATLS